MRNFQPIIYRFMSIALILNGSMLAIRWFRNANPNKDNFILVVAAISLLVGLFAFFIAPRLRRKSPEQEED